MVSPVGLGVEADQPGSIWLDQNTLHVQPPGARSFDGVDVFANGSPEAVLVVRMGEAAGGLPSRAMVGGTASATYAPPPVTVRVPLTELRNGKRSVGLDEQGNRLLIARAPADALRVRFSGDRLVFEPGEAFQFSIIPYQLPFRPNTAVRVKVELCPGRSNEAIHAATYSCQVDQPSSIPIGLKLPREEGVYDIVITAEDAGGLPLPKSVSSRLTDRLNWRRQESVQRRVQVLVLGSRADGLSTEIDASRSAPWRTLVEIDPASDGWWERLTRLPEWSEWRDGLRLGQGGLIGKGSWDNGHTSTQAHATGTLVRLAPSGETEDRTWSAYRLPIETPGLPHALEVEYPADIVQTLAVSIMEPNSSGALYPIGLDSGVDVPESPMVESDAGRLRRHRLIFWPRTRAPLVVLTNLQDKRPAVFGRIRVHAGPKHLASAFARDGSRPGRLLAASMDRPMFPENFGASETRSAETALGVDDWITFHEGGRRLVEYLDHAGFTGLMISVLADGSTIYPSALVEPTPRWDTGLFDDLARDPVRKDGLEMLLRLFGRASLSLIPALDFSAPLPELEAVIRRDGPEAVGLRWIDQHGRVLQDVAPPRRGCSPYYNVLHPRVQQAMLSVVRELIGRYAHHPAMSGLAVRLSSEGYAQLPDPQWGLDDATIDRFSRATGIRVPGEGANRLLQRHQFLAGEGASAWMAWRAAELDRFYRQVQAELRAVRPDARLYLTGGSMFGPDAARHQLKPSLLQQATWRDVLLRVGFEARRFDQEGPVLLRPRRLETGNSLPNDAARLVLGQMPDVDDCFSQMAHPGSLFFLRPRTVRLPSLDRESPFQPTYAWLAAHVSPSDAFNRRRFVHAMATLDSQTIVDGGWMLPLGQEEALRPIVAAYRKLPAVRFAKLESPQTSQPVTIRHATYAGDTYVYLVNDAPFSVRAYLNVTAPSGCRLEELTGLRTSPVLQADSSGSFVSLDLAPFDLIALRLDSTEVTLGTPRVVCPERVRQFLRLRIAEVGNRATALRNPPMLDALANPGFEQLAGASVVPDVLGSSRPTNPSSASSTIPGWTIHASSGGSIVLDPNQPRDGNYSARLRTTHLPVGIVSRAFEVPPTGRLTMSMWLRTPNPSHQPPLRIRLFGYHAGRPLVRVAQVGQAPPGQNVPQLNSQWQPVVVEIDGLPLKDLSPLSIRFDLTGPGEVQLDDVQLYHLAFSRAERVELFKRLAPAEWKLEQGELRDCLDLLEGYWPRFLLTNVPRDETNWQSATSSAARSRSTTSHPPAARPAPIPEEKTGFLNRVKGYLPQRLRF